MTVGLYKLCRHRSPRLESPLKVDPRRSLANQRETLPGRTVHLDHEVHVGQVRDALGIEVRTGIDPQIRIGHENSARDTLEAQIAVDPLIHLDHENSARGTPETDLQAQRGDQHAKQSMTVAPLVREAQEPQAQAAILATTLMGVAPTITTPVNYSSD